MRPAGKTVCRLQDLLRCMLGARELTCFHGLLTEQA